MGPSGVRFCAALRSSLETAKAGARDVRDTEPDFQTTSVFAGIADD